MKRLLLALLLFTSYSSVNAAIITVDAKVNSTGGGGSGFVTGISLTLGQHFTASAGLDDLWNAGALPRWSNADGLTGDLFATGSDDSGELAGTKIGQDFGLYTPGLSGLSLAYGTLVGSISGNYFSMGTDFDGLAVATGDLLLWYWDSNNSDNSESIAVTINTNPVPEPSILTLFGAGLVGFGLIRRKVKKS